MTGALKTSSSLASTPSSQSAPSWSWNFRLFRLAVAPGAGVGGLEEGALLGAEEGESESSSKSSNGSFPSSSSWTWEFDLTTSELSMKVVLFCKWMVSVRRRVKDNIVRVVSVFCEL